MSEFDFAKIVTRDVEFVLHHAATPSVFESIIAPFENQKNGEIALLNVLQGAIQNGVRRVIFASSASVYGGNGYFPHLKENMPLHPKSPYAASKVAGEAYMSAFADRGLETISLRYFNIFGKRQDPKSPYSGVVSIFSDRMRKGELITVFGDGKQTRDFTHVDNVVHANVLALTDRMKPNGWQVNIGCGEAISISELIETLEDILSVEAKISYGDSRPGDIKEAYAAIGLALGALGYEPIMPFKKGLRKYLKGK